MSDSLLPSDADARPVPGFPGYRVTRDGTVYGPCGFALRPTRSGRIGLYRKGKTHRHAVADLVAAAWAQPSEPEPAPVELPAPQPEPDDALQAAAATIADQAELIEELREIVAHLEADLATVTRQRDKALRQRDALAVTRLIEVAQPPAKPASRRVRQ